MKYLKINHFFFSIFISLSILFASSFLFATIINAATYYVDQNHPHASDSNPGTEALPWRTIQKAANTLVAGDRVYVKEGIYYNQRIYGGYSEVGLPNSGVAGIKPQNSGTSNAPIVYSAYPGHKVIIDQGGPDQEYIKSLGKLYNGFYIFNKSHIIISGFEIRNTWGAGVQTTSNCSYITVENCIIHNADGPAGSNIGAISFDSCSHCVARNNRLYNVFVNGDMSNQNASALGNNYHMEYALIENNEMFNAANGIFHKRSSGNKGAIIRNNIIHNVKRHGIWYSVGGTGDPAHKDQEVYQNIFYNVPTAIRASTHETATPSTGLDIYNNVFSNVNTAIAISSYFDVRMHNNIFHNIIRNYPENGFAIVTIGAPSTYSITYSNYNDFYPNIPFELNRYSTQKVTYSSLSTWQVGTGFDLNSFSHDPLFVNPQAYNFRLSHNSPCVNAGIDRQDYDGDGNTTERINMGAYITGNEIIGPIRPSPPRNLRIQ